MYKSIIKPILFLISPEKAHKLTVNLLKILLAIPGVKWIFEKSLSVGKYNSEIEIAGLKFPNRVGLAAGFDKDGKYYEEMSALGFGFIEIGTVTPLSQPGNDRPRLFRLPNDSALINRMGFNNDGVDEMVSRLKNRKKSGIIIGGNIGKNKVTPNENAVQDYIICFERLYDYVDYFVVNVSSPNTPGLRTLQEKEPLKKILSQLMDLNRSKPRQKAVFLKIAPDMTDDQLDDIIEVVEATKLDGIIATNTTISREGLTTSVDHIGAGGLSGKPLRERSTEVIRYLHEKTDGQLTIIGVGGIYSTEDAIEKIQAGASLVQLYSGLIYEGPSLIKKINKKLSDLKQ